MASRTTISYSFEGLKETDDALSQFSKATARNIGRRALAAGGKMIADHAASIAADDPETGPPDLHRSIVVSSRLKDRRGLQEFHAEMSATGNVADAVSALREARRTTKSDDVVTMFVGPAGLPAKYAHLVEWGTVHSRAQPFMTPAWEAEKDNALQIIAKELKKQIDLAAKRAAKRLAKLAAQMAGG